MILFQVYILKNASQGSVQGGYLEAERPFGFRNSGAGDMMKVVDGSSKGGENWGDLEVTQDASR